MPKLSHTAVGALSWAVRHGPRVLAWGVLLGATGLLVSAEARRSDWPEGVSAVTDIVYRRTPDRRLRLDVYQPSRDVSRPPGGCPAIVAIHGGGWTGGSRISFGRMVARLAQHGYVVVSVDYTLCRPGRPSWPAALDDVRAAVRWTRQHADEYEIDPRRLIALGSSAGGHLAALLGTTSGGDADLKVQAVIDLYGPSDLGVLATENAVAVPAIANFLGGSLAQFPERYAAASPARRVSAESPPMLLIHGANDTHVPPSQSQLLDRALRDAGVFSRMLLIPGARHGFELRADGQHDLLRAALAFLEIIGNTTVKAPAP